MDPSIEQTPAATRRCGDATFLMNIGHEDSRHRCCRRLEARTSRPLKHDVTVKAA